MKILVAYFSAEGTTAAMANKLASAVGADVFEIVPEKPYAPADIKWTNPLARCNREKLGKKDVPVAGSVEDWDQYDLVCLGFPIWYYEAPNVVHTFCKGYDWTGKKVVLFGTSGGAEIGKTAEKLAPDMKGGPEIVHAEVFRSAADLCAVAETLK